MENALSHHPKTRFIWNHAGVSRRIDVPALPNELRRMLAAYPNLYIDLSWVVFEDYVYRFDEQTEKSKLNRDWIRLVEAFPDRFMIGSEVVKKPSRAARVQGARSAGTGVYTEYMRIPSTAQRRNRAAQ